MNKLQKNMLIAVMLTSVCILNVEAVSSDEATGIHIGHRTTTYPTWVERAEEIVTIDLDGRVTNYVSFDWMPEGYAWVSSGYLDLNEDGTFTVGQNGSGSLTFHGRHLDVQVYFPAALNSLEANVHFQGHRTDKAFDLPLPWLPGPGQ